LWFSRIFDRRGIALLGFRLLGGFGSLHLPGTVVGLTLDVVLRGHSREEQESGVAQLLAAPQNDLCATLTVLDGSLDFNLPAFRLANIAHLFEIAREHDYGERARLAVLAKVEELHALAFVSSTCSTVPLMHWFVPRCLLASANDTPPGSELLRAKETALIIRTAARTVKKKENYSKETRND
jgi:hypothetical protein